MRLTVAKQSIIGGLVLMTTPILFFHDPLRALQIVVLWLLLIILSTLLLSWV